MKSTITASIALLLPLSGLVTAQQILTSGNGQLPSCAQSCAPLVSAAQGCGSTWTCFCPKAWTSIQAAPSGVCAQYCSNPADNTAVTTWFTNNCGSDNGASEHGGSNGGATQSGSAGTSTTSVPPVSAPSTSTSGGEVASSPTTQTGSWWHNHWKWVIMLIVLAVGLFALAMIGLWLKRRYRRRQDQIREGFNSGITSRAPPPTQPSMAHVASSSRPNDSTFMGAGGVEASGSGRNSPVRTREAFMPYGYGYTRSESKLGSYNDHERSSPLARGGTPVGDLERGGAGMGTAETPDSAPKKSRRVLVRERTMDNEESPEIERARR